MFLKMKMDCKMEMEYLLDTNAYFNFLNELSNSIPSERKDEILGLNTRRFYISEITSIEIISVLENMQEEIVEAVKSVIV